jgi:hypothetical protein
LPLCDQLQHKLNSPTVSYLGTNSFTISAGRKILPTLILLESSGLYEITTYVLAAAATSFIARYRLVGKWPKQTVERIDPPGITALVRERYAGVLGALVLLLLATAWEAYRVTGRFGFPDLCPFDAAQPILWPDARLYRDRYLFSWRFLLGAGCGSDVPVSKHDRLRTLEYLAGTRFTPPGERKMM